MSVKILSDKLYAKWFIGQRNDVVIFRQGSGWESLPLFPQFLFQGIGDLLQRFIRLFKAEGFDFDEDLDRLFVLSLIDMIGFDIQCAEELSDQVVETQILFPSVLQHKIVGPFLFEQRYSSGILSAEVLVEQKRGKRLFYAFELGIEGTIVEVDLFDDRIAFDVVVTVVEF